MLGGKGSIDVALEKDGRAIACEISVTTTPEWELGNIQKCLASGFEKVFLLSQEKKYLANAQELIRENLEPAEVDRIKCLTIEEFIEFLEQEEAKSAEKEQIIGGRKVRVRQRALSETEKKTRRRAITQTILQAMKRMKDKT